MKDLFQLEMVSASNKYILSTSVASMADVFHEKNILQNTLSYTVHSHC